MDGRKGHALGSIFGDRKGRAPPATPLPSASMSTFLAVVDRLETLLDAETRALAASQPVDVGEFGNRKRQGLLEMTRAMRAAASAENNAEIRARLGRFAKTLERNRVVLETQLRAVREIADIISHSIKDSESDGTYSAYAGRQ